MKIRTVDGDGERPVTIDDDNNNTVAFYAPVTLREVEACGVPLDSAFGIDAAEHEELLDAPDILRVVFSVYLNDSWDDAADAVGYATNLECYDYRFGADAGWRSCLARSPRGGRAPNATNRLHALLHQTVPGWWGMLDTAAIPFQEWAEEAKHNAEEWHTDEE